MLNVSKSEELQPWYRQWAYGQLSPMRQDILHQHHSNTLSRIRDRMVISKAITAVPLTPDGSRPEARLPWASPSILSLLCRAAATLPHLAESPWSPQYLCFSSSGSELLQASTFPQGLPRWGSELTSHCDLRIFGHYDDQYTLQPGTPVPSPKT